MYKKKGNQTGSALGEVDFCLSSGFDEFDFKTELPLECLLENQCITDDEYREIWINTPKEEHIMNELKISYSKVIEGGTSS
jgi:hypothetical protein